MSAKSAKGSQIGFLNHFSTSFYGMVIMVRGYQKRVVFMKNTGSEFFDEAYFVVCDDKMGGSEADMISEANRIIDEAGGSIRENRVGMRWLLVAVSFLSGSLLTALSAFIFGAFI